ncbi:hypothetical protein Golomagni_06261, partial [Golovinomyces magnicellulatus]
MSYQDDWPTLEDGTDFDGRDTLTLALKGESPFGKEWDVVLLVKEIEQNLQAKVIDIPLVYHGSNNYGFHIHFSNRPDVVARVARGDVNMPSYEGLSIDKQIPELQFEAATYTLLYSESNVPVSRLLYHRVPLQHKGPRVDKPRDILGRRLLVFERADGENNIWSELDSSQKAHLLAQAARIRASLYNFQVPLEFSTTWLRERLFDQKPESFQIPVSPTRDFCIELFTSKINATIRNLGDMIGWESDNNTVGPIAADAKQKLLRAIPCIIPEDDGQGDLFRLVLEHGDFGIHNMSITRDADSSPTITSIYDLETACITPAILSDPLMAVIVDLVTDKNANPSITRVEDDETPTELEEYQTWAKQYIE